MSTARAAHTDTPSGTDRVLEQLRMDESLGPPELVTILTHCAAVAASADFRLLQAAALLHEEYALTHGLKIAAHVGDEPADSIEHLHTKTLDATEARTQFGPDGLEQAIAAVGAATNTPPARARELILAGTTMRYHLPHTGQLLARGRIDLTRFLLIVQRTTLCTEAILPELDDTLSREIRARAPMSLTRFRTLIDATITRIDPTAARQRLEHANKARHITIRPDHHTPGHSRLTGSLPAHNAAGLDARLTAMAQAVHPTDPRTLTQRRADALIALTNNTQHLACTCPHCRPNSAPAPKSATPSATPTPAPAAQPATPPAPQASPASPVTPSPGAPRPTFHIIVSLATLLGANDCPAFLDGHGILDADVARDLVREATRSYIHTNGPLPTTPPINTPPPTGPPIPPTTAPPDTAPPPSDSDPVFDRRNTGYTPSRSLRGLVTAGELCCVFPGCTTAVHACDLDHTTPYTDGGHTRRTNLKPLCRFHHRLKTFDVGWRDYQDPLGTVAFRAPTGHYFIGNAYTGYDLFAELRPDTPRMSMPPPDHTHPARTQISRIRHDRIATHTRALERWERAHPPPF